MNDSNETQYGECSQSAPFVESISIKVILILEILIGLSSSISNSLLIVAVWRVSVFHANLRWLLINLSLNLFWYASAITMKAAYLLSITLLGDPCLLMIDSIICKRWELLYVTPFLNTVYSLISVGVERLFSTIRYRSYDRSSRIPWLACVFIPAIWVGTLANQLAVLSSLRSQTLPICLSFIFVKFSVVRATILANSTMEIIAVMLISILHVWNLHKRDRAVNAAWIKHGYSLASRFQIIQNVDINKLLLPSVISHATAHMLYMAFLTVLLLGTELSLKIKVILIHCSFVWFTAYGTTHALLAFSRHPQLKQTLAKWAPSALRNVLNRKRKKVEAHHFSTSANLHFEMLSKMWAINEPNGVNANIAASKSPALKVMFANRSTSPAVRINTEKDKVAWCNATWDSVFCWPLAPANTTALLQCPPVEGLVANEMITKFCDYSGRWADTNMRSCLVHSSSIKECIECTSGFCARICDFSDLGVLDNIPEETTTAVIEKRFTNAFVSGSADIVEYVGLSLSILDILITLFLILFTLRRQWRLNQVRVGLLTALLIMCILWLAVRIDKNLKDSTYSYKGIIFINRPVCEAFLGLLEWSKLFVASWLACVCFHGLLEVVKPAVARRCMNLIFYALFTFVYSSIVVAVWVVLVKFAEDVGHEYMCCILTYVYPAAISCANKYESRPLFHVITWPCFVLISAATILAFIHTLRAMFKVCGHAERPNPNKRKMMQGIVHLIICLYAAVFWYFNYMAVFSDEVFSSTGRPSTLLTAVATYVVYFLGAFIAVWIGACQCCLPAKEV